jgi:hypothetical protein
MSDTNKATPIAGTWQETLAKSATLFDRSAAGRKKASALLWEGAQEATVEWLNESDTDPHAEVMYADVLDILGTPRKGDASKIRTVALAVKNNGLVLSLYPNLSKAYAEARRLTQTVKVHAAEDEAAEKAVSEIVANAPKSSSKPEGAAFIVLSQGVDEAARVLLDALGATNAAAHRSLLRAISQEIAGRVPKPAPKAPKSTAPKGAAKAAKGTAKKAAAPKPGDGASKPKPVKKAAPVKAEEPGTEEPTAGDMFDEFDLDSDDTAEAPAPVQAAAKPKPKPVRRGPVRRSA